jgi:hypothetical protein
MVRNLEFLRGFPVVIGCLDILTAPFLARLRTNAFDAILMASSLSPQGRTDILRREAGFQITGPIDEFEDPLRCGYG